MPLGQRLLTLLVLGVAALGALGEKFPTENDVLVLGDDNFDQALKEHDILLVEFYAPWCGHCKKLEPEYAKAAGILAKHDPPLYIAKVDATKHPKVSEAQQLRGYPTIKLFKGGAASDYEGDRSAEAIAEYVIKKSGPPVVTLKTVKDAEDFLANNPKAGIAFFSSLASAGAKNFTAYASKYDSYPLAYTENADVKKKFKIGAKDTLQFTTAEGSFTRELDWAKGDEDLATWIFGHAVPLLFKYDPQAARELFNGPIKVHLLSFLDGEAKDFSSTVDVIKSGAEKTRTSALTIFVPKTEDRILGAFDLTAKDVPKLVIADLRGGPMKRYIYEEAKITKAGIQTFMSKFFKGEIKPKLKSEEPAPADWEGAVKVIKGKSFKEKVVNSDQDVLLEFYAPWCGHCRQLEPKFEELASKLNTSKSVVIAKMDATANEVDHPGVNVQGYPTILFFKAGAKDSPISYDQAREVDSFIAWLKKHATNPAELPAGEEDTSEAAAVKEEL